MKLFWSSRSPFVRKVMVAAHEVGIAGRIRTERVVVAANKPNADVMAVNPLNKIPTLVLDDGTALYDLRVICEYFDTLHAGAKLFPLDRGARWTALRRQALGDGLMEASVLRVGEQARPREAQSEPHLAAYRLKIARTLDVLEREAEGLASADRDRAHCHRLRAGAPRLPVRRRRLACGPRQARDLVCRLRAPPIDASHRVCRRLLRAKDITA